MKMNKKELKKEINYNVKEYEIIRNEVSKIDDVVLKMQSYFILDSIKKCTSNKEKLNKYITRLKYDFLKIDSYKDSKKMFDYLETFEKRLINIF